MPKYILGISAFYHDSAACLLKDGLPIAAAQEERFTRIKHDDSIPVNAVNYCLKEAKIDINQVDCLAYYEKPILKFDRVLTTYIESAPKSFLAFKSAMKSMLTKKLWVPNQLKKHLGFKGEVNYVNHHESHAASACFTAPFHKSAFLTIDGVGEWATTTMGTVDKTKITTTKEIHFPHSVGLLYSAFTYYCGFRVNSGEYKLMGLAPYGEPKYAELIKSEIVLIRPDGSIKLNMKHFAFNSGFKMISDSFCKVFGQPERNPDSEFTQFYKDVARSIQDVLEEIVLLLAQHVKTTTGEENLCFAGGVALNCVANGKLLNSGTFKNIWIQPAAGDAGGALGAALLVHYHNNPNKRLETPNELQYNTYLGSSFNESEVKKVLEERELVYHHIKDKDQAEYLAKLISKKQVIGWFKGRMEFGPRALGARSILASPVFEDMNSYVNLKIKKRESFRPFAPLVKADKAFEWFDIDNESKTMLFTYTCKQPEKIPSCVHVDNSARVQTLSIKDNPKLYGLLDEVEKEMGCPVLINTSFNVRGEPIVNSPIDAIRCFFNTEMDVLVLEDFILLKSEQPLALTKNIEFELD